MIKLSPDTHALIKLFFEDAHERDVIGKKLENQCGDNIYSCGDGSPESLERLRFAVLKLVNESDQDIDYWIEIARTDWRDLFMMAGFGYDVNEHEKWKERVLTKKSSRRSTAADL